MPNPIPASSIVIDDILFASLTNYVKQANDVTVSLFEEILAFKNNELQTCLAELNILLSQATMSELDKRRDESPQSLAASQQSYCKMLKPKP